MSGKGPKGYLEEALGTGTTGMHNALRNALAVKLQTQNLSVRHSANEVVPHFARMKSDQRCEQPRHPNTYLRKLLD